MENEVAGKETNDELLSLRRQSDGLMLAKHLELIGNYKSYSDEELEQIHWEENTNTRIDTWTNENKLAVRSCLYILHFERVFKVGISSERNLKRRIYQNERVFKNLGFGKLDKRRSYIFTSPERHHVNYIEEVIKSKFNNVVSEERFIGYTETYCLSNKPAILSLVRLLMYRLTTFLEMEITCGCVLGDSRDNFHEMFPSLMNYKPKLKHHSEHSYYEFFDRDITKE